MYIGLYVYVFNKKKKIKKMKGIKTELENALM